MLEEEFSEESVAALGPAAPAVAAETRTWAAEEWVIVTELTQRYQASVSACVFASHLPQATPYRPP